MRTNQSLLSVSNNYAWNNILQGNHSAYGVACRGKFVNLYQMQEKKQNTFRFVQLHELSLNGFAIQSTDLLFKAPNLHEYFIIQRVYASVSSIRCPFQPLFAHVT